MIAALQTWAAAVMGVVIVVVVSLAVVTAAVIAVAIAVTSPSVPAFVNAVPIAECSTEIAVMNCDAKSKAVPHSAGAEVLTTGAGAGPATVTVETGAVALLLPLAPAAPMVMARMTATG